MKKIAIVLTVMLLVVAAVYMQRQQIIAWIFAPTQTQFPTQAEPSMQTTDAEVVVEQPQRRIEDLSIPWEIAFLPDDSYLITERPGQLLRVSQDARNPIIVDGVVHVGEGGLLGLALHPQFSENQYVYLYMTTQGETGLVNRVERYRFALTTNKLSERMVIIDQIPGAQNHDGGRIAFGPDGYLYITTGDAQQPALAQDTTSLAGKILRVAADGAVPSDNPFGNPVYSYGHRNVQGIAWDSSGRLWASEHGPSGPQTGNDEINLITAGANYGWPEIKGTEQAPGMETPIIESGTEETWAPGGVEIIGSTLYFVGLRGQALYVAEITGDTLTNIRVRHRQEFGRLRTVAHGSDGKLYLLTSNTDGRGQAREGDDAVIVVAP